MTEEPIFILGCPRSGTTLLRVMLNAHPRIAVPPETRFLIPAYVHRARFGDLRREAARRRLAEFVVDRPASRFGRLGVPAEQARAAVMAAEPTLGAALGAVFAQYAGRFGKARWGDKRPFYYSFIDELDALFPTAQFVHVVRDGRACVTSLKRPPFDYGTARAATTWLNAMASCRASAGRLGPERYAEVRYEDLVADPQTSLRALCAFLGEDFAPAMCTPEDVVDDVVPAGFEQHRQIKAGVNTASVERWRSELPPAEIALLESVGGAWLAASGYALTRAGRAPVLAATRVRLAHRRYLRTLRLWRRAEAAQPAPAVGGSAPAPAQPAPPAQPAQPATAPPAPTGGAASLANRATRGALRRGRRLVRKARRAQQVRRRRSLLDL